MIGSPQLRLTWGIWPEMSIWQNWDTQLCCGVCRTIEACNLVARNTCDEDWRRFSWEILSGKRSTNGQSNRWHIWRHIWRYNLTSCHAIQHDTSRLETMARNVWSSINSAPTSVTTPATSQLVRSWVPVPYYMLALPKYFTILVAIPCWPQIKLWW